MAVALLLALVGCGGSPTGPVATVEQVVIADGDLVIGVGQESPLVAIALGAGGTVVNTTISWRSTSPAVATVSGSGRLTGVTEGTSLVIASAGGKADTIGVTVQGVPPSGVQAVRISDDDLLLGIGDIDTLNAIALGAGGAVINTPITWQSTAVTVATVASSGRVDALTPGTARMIASAGGKADTVEVVVHGPLEVITVQIGQFVIKSSDTTRVTATGRDFGGRPVPITPIWASEDTTVAVVAPNGLVLGLKYNANTIITATVGNLVAFTTISVIPSTITRVRLLATADTIGLGTTFPMAVEVTDEFDVQVTDRVVTWTSTNPDVVSITSSGTILAVSPGVATVRATVDGLSVEKTFTVLAIPQNVYLLEVVNHLLAPVRIFVNDSEVVTIAERSSASLQLTKVAEATVRWRLIRPKAGTAGEPLLETFPAVANPDGVVRFEIDNVLNGETYYTPLIRSLVPDKLNAEMQPRDLAGTCGCAISSAEDDRRFGYWLLRPGATVTIFNPATPALTTVIPVNAAQVAPVTGIWRTTVLTAP